MIRIVRPETFTKSLWRNGRGVSWEIADQGPREGADFGWRLSIADIAEDVPFSVYGPVDRWFTLLEGNGLSLSFANGKTLIAAVREPHFFPCDVPANCALADGPCRALNLFVARNEWSAAVRILTVDDVAEFDPAGRTVVMFAFDGEISVACHGMVSVLKAGSAAVLDTGNPIICAAARRTTLYVADLGKMA